MSSESNQEQLQVQLAKRVQERIDLTIKDIVEQKDKRDLFNFAYELRK